VEAKRERQRSAEYKAQRNERLRKKALAKREAEKEQEKLDAKEAARRELAVRALCRRRLMPYIIRNQPSYKAGWVHREICEELEEFSAAVERGESPRLMIWVPPRHGKLVADSEPVLTPDGWTTHGQLKKGDYVFGLDGLPTKVVGRSAPDMACMEVMTSTGDSIKVHPAHEWTVYNALSRKWVTMETRELAAAGVRWEGKDGRKRFRFQLPRIAALHFTEKSYLLDPYILGAWLGDGTTNAPIITHAVDETEVVTAIANASRYKATTRLRDGYSSTTFTGGMVTVLKRIGVFGYKHIPEVYKHGSIPQRLQLLAGLIDTDGSVDKGGRVRISNMNARLAGDIVELVRGLGWRAGISTGAARIGRTTGHDSKNAEYTVHFSPDSAIPTRLPRKSIQPKSRRLPNSITCVRPCPPEKGRCIQVEREDGLYLVGKKLTPTHNSMIASWHFPAWHLGRNPTHEIIACSYAAALAMGFSRKARALVQDEDFVKIFGKTRLNREVMNAENWQTLDGGGYRAAGVGGPITGTGAHVLIIDDPVKNWEEADSETVRESTLEWYTSTAYTRLSPGGGVLLIQTRWHEDDLSGRLSEMMEKDPYADQWRIIDYAATAVKDEKHRQVGGALHPERYDELALRRIEKNVGPRVWNALYQQRPAPEEGAYFKREHLRHYAIDQLPYDLTYYTAWDLAITAKEDNDPTAGFVVGVDENDQWWIVDRYYGRWETFDIVENIINSIERYEPAATWIEKDKVALAVGPILERTMQERRVRGYVEQVPSGRKDKVQRARSLQGLVQAGKVRIPVDAPWAGDLEQELLKFPHGKHDDQVDALAYMAIQLDQMTGSPRRQIRYPQPISWKDKLGSLVGRTRERKSYLSS
jgi:predicted phage terminase large subunit-like protein